LHQTAHRDRLFLQPKNQEQRSRERAGGCFRRERQQIENQRQAIQDPGAPGSFVNKRNPGKQRQQEEKAHQHVFAFGDPCHRLDLHWM
jgi:hypothetical protein